MNKKIFIILCIVLITIIIPIVSLGINKLVGSNIKLAELNQKNTINQNEIKSNLEKYGGIYTGTDNIPYSISSNDEHDTSIARDEETVRLHEEKMKKLENIYLKYESARYKEVEKELEEDSTIIYTVGQPTNPQLNFCYLTLDILDNYNLEKDEENLLKESLEDMYVYTKSHPELKNRFDKYINN